MKIQWHRVIFVFLVFLLIAVSLWLHQNAHRTHRAWSSFGEEVSELSSMPVGVAFIYLALSFGFVMFILWMASRVVKWFKE